MLQKVGFIAIIGIIILATSCNTPYHAAKRKKGQQCDCPKDTKTKHHKSKKYR